MQIEFLELVQLKIKIRLDNLNRTIEKENCVKTEVTYLKIPIFEVFLIVTAEKTFEPKNFTFNFDSKIKNHLKLVLPDHPSKMT